MSKILILVFMSLPLDSINAKEPPVAKLAPSASVASLYTEETVCVNGVCQVVRREAVASTYSVVYSDIIHVTNNRTIYPESVPVASRRRTGLGWTFSIIFSGPPLSVRFAGGLSERRATRRLLGGVGCQ